MLIFVAFGARADLGQRGRADVDGDSSSGLQSHEQRWQQQTYILCPGQGAQVVGMGKDFYDGLAGGQGGLRAGQPRAGLRSGGALLRRARKSG